MYPPPPGPERAPENTSPAPSEMRVAVKIMEMVAISTPMVASLAVRVRNTSRFCLLYFRAGRLSKKAGTPEAKLRKKPKRNRIRHPAPTAATSAFDTIIRQVPTAPSRMEAPKIQRRFSPSG